MATILAVDTSATPVSCAVLRDGRVVASYYLHTPLTHSQTLMPMIEHVLSTASLSVGDMDYLAVNAGPGSFTGVRIGVSAVKGLAFADDKPCVAVSTLAAMAENFRGMPFDGLICPVMDARCQQVYTAFFEQKSDGSVVRMTPDEAIPIEELKERIKKQNKLTIFVGDGSEMCYNVLKAEIPLVSLSPISLRYQSAVGTALAAAAMAVRGETVSADRLLPAYLRLPQAERELRSRLAAQE